MKESTFPPLPGSPLALRAGAPATSAPGGPDTGSRSAQRRRMVAVVRGRTARCGGSVSGRSAGRTPTETLNPGAGVMESVTLEDVAVGLIQEWALLDDARRNLYRYVLLDNCRTLAPRGTPSCKACLVSQVGPREELMTAEQGILCATGVDWESQLKPKESTPLQDILEEHSSHDLQMGLGLDLRMQIKPMMGERGTPLTPGDRSALQESPWSSEDTASLGSGLLGGPQPQPGKPRGLKVAVQIQKVATPEPALRLLNLLGAGGSAVPAQDPTWLQEESTEEEAVAPGTLNTCLQQREELCVTERGIFPGTHLGDQLCKASTFSHLEQREELCVTERGIFPGTHLEPQLQPQDSIPNQDIFAEIPSIGMKRKKSTSKKPHESNENDSSLWQSICLKELRVEMEQPQTGEKLYKCNVLGKPINSIKPLFQYQRIPAGGNPCEYRENGKPFFQTAHLIVSEKIHSGDKTYACNKCEKSFRYSSDLIRHEKTHTVEKCFECQECRQAFKYSSNLRRHMRTHTGEKPFECSQCGKTFTRNFNLILHQRNHTGEKPYECKDCGKAFNQPSSLRSHVRTHTGEKPFECGQCGKAFREHSSLKTHLRTHTREKPYECNQCGKPFRTSTHLNVHKRIHTGEKLYECATCGQVLSRLSTLKSHMRTHTGEKPYACQECGRAFSEPSSLRKHLRTHTGKKPYACQECGRAFGQSSHLIVHVRTHTAGRPYECNQCEKAFRHSSSLTVHKRTHARRENVRTGGLPLSVSLAYGGPHAD
ncbi:hypothetical protein EI555_007139 [Monodon monoceros]|uniref:Zinc finger protein 333 n=1 Tax=Monodon monoceros TaxID=40151 RepID=A0A4V5P741_MONMO|nr:hypothetical protein EI555_007139 [Monodon monoceros]